jgi:hypothetical protein
MPAALMAKAGCCDFAALPVFVECGFQVIVYHMVLI